MRAEFGYYPRVYRSTVGPIVVENMPDLDAKIANVRGSERVRRDWYYARERSRVFALPKTHLLSHAGATGEEHLEFLVWCFGFFEGMRLTTTAAGFLDATPIARHSLTDIVWLGDSLELALATAEAFWHQYAGDPRVSKILCGVIHAYFLAQTRNLLSYEQFVWLYTALDGCNAVEERIRRPQRAAARAMASSGTGRRTTHAERIQILCNTFGMPVPDWANPMTSSTIATVRNDTIHEGLFFDEPLGFRSFGGSNLDKHVIGSMIALVSRIVVAILGVPAVSYIQSSLTSRQNHGVQL